MREIKFRAYCGLTKTMINDYCVLRDNEFIGYDTTNNTHYIEAIMQFTGLKDKNGREIYHKDIVRTPNGIFVIEWNQLHNCWALFRNGSMQSEIISDWVNEDGTTPARWEVKEFEVIGNIHENPELLEAK